MCAMDSFTEYVRTVCKNGSISNRGFGKRGFEICISF